AGRLGGRRVRRRGRPGPARGRVARPARRALIAVRVTRCAEERGTVRPEQRSSRGKERQPTAVFNAWNTAIAYFSAFAVFTVLPPSAATRYGPTLVPTTAMVVVTPCSVLVPVPPSTGPAPAAGVVSVCTGQLWSAASPSISVCSFCTSVWAV